MLQTEAGQSALTRARTIASNEQKSPESMGFDLNDQGEVVLRQAPSFETHDMIKRGFDARLNEARNQVTGELDLTNNPVLQGINNLRKRYVGRLDQLNEIYPKARAAYGEHAQLKDALDRGFDAPSNLVDRDLNAVVGDLSPPQLAEYQRGYATNMADTARRARLVSDPYKSIYGGTDQIDKVKTLFPQGAPQFNRINELEQDMAKTRHEVLGGAATAGRLGADAQLGGGVGTAALDVGTHLATGSPLGMGTVLRMALKGIGDSAKLGMGKKAVSLADDIAPQLLNPNPAEANALLEELIARSAFRVGRKQAAGRWGGVLGASGLPTIAGAAAPYFVGN